MHTHTNTHTHTRTHAHMHTHIHTHTHTHTHTHIHRGKHISSPLSGVRRALHVSIFTIHTGYLLFKVLKSTSNAQMSKTRRDIVKRRDSITMIPSMLTHSMLARAHRVSVKWLHNIHAGTACPKLVVSFHPFSWGQWCMMARWVPYYNTRWQRAYYCCRCCSCYHCHDAELLHRKNPWNHRILWPNQFASLFNHNTVLFYWLRNHFLVQSIPF